MPTIAASRTTMDGIFTARELTTAEASKRNVTLHLNRDGTVQLVTEFIGRGTLVECGTWEVNQSRAQVTLTDLQGQAINLRMIFELNGNDLVYVGPDPHAFGANGITLARVTAA